ncbi:BZ3500_MvSof-1268-A1-R1_Chr2-1g04137 [Microbotryum saponariae]|uniref:BZ3500_MvSof-1268-A1-R1_Chr2-1g04137 protein n=1 Tax=Microbotryum saponariae TaxID=289078 RepID=A0A2X0KPK0_9BASI|nr:BZ3500_MvSof-1268-A1-R1_Chr2-1g04137 [Microbotryum saponariae]SCZ91124.1 BZ3501_MvSof-1269-A2-R1_Chr2-1g03793 [Microbotryum saponariae]
MSYNDSSVTRGFSFNSSDNGWPIPPARFRQENGDLGSGRARGREGTTAESAGSDGGDHDDWRGTKGSRQYYIRGCNEDGTHFFGGEGVFTAERRAMTELAAARAAQCICPSSSGGNSAVMLAGREFKMEQDSSRLDAIHAVWGNASTKINRYYNAQMYGIQDGC